MTGPLYLDHAATAFPKAPGVTAAVADFLEHAAGNPGRGGHRLALAAARAQEEARAAVAAVLGARVERTLLGPGATFWLNTVLNSLIVPGDRVVVSSLEHNAVMRPLRHLERTQGVTVVSVAGDRCGVPSPEEVRAAVAAAPTRAVVLTHASNVTGAVLPVAAIARAVAPVPVVVDGAQTAGSLPVDVASLTAAAFVASGHKGLLGPPGTGVLVLGEGVEVEPLVRGGTGSASQSELMPRELPDRLEAGTGNTAGFVGLGAACRWLAETGIAALHELETALAQAHAAALAEVPGVRLVGFEPRAERVAVLSFTVDGVDAGELARRLDREHAILLRAGLHCSPAAHRRLGTLPGGTLRVGVGPFTPTDAPERLAAAVRQTAAALRE